MDEAQIIKTLAEICERDTIDINSNLHDDLGVDSFRHAELAFALEQKLGRTLPDEAFNTCETPADIIRLIKSL